MNYYSNPYSTFFLAFNAARSMKILSSKFNVLYLQRALQNGFLISDSMFSSRSWNIFRLKVLQPLSPQAVESSNLQDIRLTGIGREPRKPTGRPEVCTPTKATKSIWKLPVEDTKSTYVQPELFSSRMEIRLPPI